MQYVYYWKDAMNQIPLAPPAPLANVPTPAQPLGFFARRRAGRRNWLDAAPATAYDEPVHVMPTVIGPLYLVADPEGVRRVLVEEFTDFPRHAIHLTLTQLVFGQGLLSSDGETWRTHRKLMAPSFEPRTVAGYACGIAEAARTFAPRWDAVPEGEAIDIAEEMQALALRMVSRALFSTDSERAMDVAGRAMREALAIRPSMLDLLPVVSKLREAGNVRRIAAVFAEFDAVIAELVAARQGGAGADDFLARLVAARDAETGVRLVPQDLRDQVVTIYLAGHETTAVALTWIWYVLSQRPQAEARLIAELGAVLGARPPTADDIPRLTFTRALIQEVMRLYPPVPNLLARRAAKATEICGVPIPKGAVVGVTPWIVHRHRRLWPDPETFDPERFLTPDPARPRLAYIPFGAGPRVCIGAQLALTEITLALATLAPRWRLRLAPGETVELQHRATLRPVGGMRMMLERR
jgi:cytochrome P450